MARQQGDAEIVREAKKRHERCVTWETAARHNADLDVRFAEGDAYNQFQWDSASRMRRGDRPCLTNNKVRQHNLQIVNDARQNKAQIKVTPVGGRATYEAAQVFSSIVRRIEYQSKATDAYSTAIFHQVQSGIGYVRVVLDYVDEESFDQDIFIRRVADPKTIYIDPDAKEYDKSDMRFAFVFSDIPREQWEAEHGKDDMPAPATLEHSDGWNDRDHVREAEYWRHNESTAKLHLLIDGSTIRDADIPAGDMGGLVRAQIIKSRSVAVPEVEWFRIVGDRVEERKVWPGRYIPIVPFIGEETVIDGKLDRKGHTRALIDPQRMYNYMSSSAAEQVALQTKSPYVTPARAIEGYQKFWDAANTENHPYMPYNDIDDDGRPIAPPQRAQPPVMAQAYVEGMNLAREDMMMVSGQYQAEMGMPSNERSGVAIQQRQRQGDNATYHFIDNQAKGIRQIGRIVLGLIPKVYDVARVIKIMAEDGSESDVHVVPNAPEAHQFMALGENGPQPVSPEDADKITADPDQPNPRVIFNPQVGRYDVEADVGPAFGTQRQEAANAFSQIMANNPAAFQVIGDFWAQSSDFPGADELAERLKRGLPAQYKAGPDPAVAQVQQMAQQLLGKADAEIADLKRQLTAAQDAVKGRSATIDTDNYRSETERLKAVAAADPNAAKVLIRSMLSDLLGMPALPVMHEHAAADALHEQSLQPAPMPQTIPPAAGLGQ